MKKVAGVVIAIILAIAMIASSSTMVVAEEDDNVEPIPIDKGPEIRASDYTINNESVISTSLQDSTLGADWGVGKSAYWFYLDNYYGYYDFTLYTCMAENSTAQIWVQDDLSWPDGDSRPTPNITSEQANDILSEFTDTILPTDTTYFGTPAYRDGTKAAFDDIYGPDDYYADSEERYVILVSNIRDENYYDPSYPYYIAGFFSPSYALWFDRNIITIDCLDWENRMGPDGSRPYLYDGTVAHEFQHLIHNDLDPMETTWINEGCSMYAETLCGYGFQESDAEFFFKTPDNSLIHWGDQGDINILADYGQVYLFMMYLNDHYGGPDIISEIANNDLQGRESISDSLSNLGYTNAFEDVFRYWTFANLLRNESDPYSYLSHNMDKLMPVHMLYATSNAFTGSSFGNTYTLLDDDTKFSNLSPWGTDYIWIEGANTSDIIDILFDGYDHPSPIWQETDFGDSIHMDTFWSHELNLTDTIIAKNINLEGTTTPELSFDTWYDIEQYWDYGFVQVSTDGGNTWNSLSNSNTENTLDQDGLPAIDANLPGFTGESGGWNTETFDLTPYAGMDILIGFRYMTDWGTTKEGWYIDNILIKDNSTTLLNDSCSDISEWQGWCEIYDIGTDFDISFYNPASNTITQIPLNDTTKSGRSIANFSLGDGILIVNYTPPHDIQNKVDYWVQFTEKQSNGAATSSFPLFTTALNKVNPVLDSALAAIAAAEEEGKDTSSINALMEQVNEHIANSSTGANYVYKANQLRLAMQTLEEVMSQLSEL